MNEYTIASLENMLRWINLTAGMMDEVSKTAFYSEYVDDTVCLIPVSSVVSMSVGLQTYAGILNFILDLEVSGNE